MTPGLLLLRELHRLYKLPVLHELLFKMSSNPKSAEIKLLVNGSNVHPVRTSHTNLLAFLRSELKLTGTKTGCATGNCGACTVLIDDNAMQSCQVSLTAADNSNVQTIESIVQTPLGKQIVAALARYDAAQCGYCLPGIVVAAYAEMQSVDTPDPVHALDRNLCRCGTHSRILTALREVMAVKSTAP